MTSGECFSVFDLISVSILSSIDQSTQLVTLHSKKFTVENILLLKCFVGGLLRGRNKNHTMKVRSGWSHGVMVSTLDFESSDPSSNLGGTFLFPFPELQSRL